jgi:predicted negative regulator of RcsB-dependent stress response
MPGDVYSGLANASMEKGALDQADGYLEQAIASFHAEGDRRREALVINNRGLLRRLQGRLDEAEVLHLESARIREEIGDKVGVGRVHNMLAVVYNERGKFDQALASGAIALEVAVQAEDTLYVGTAHAQLGDARLGLGQFEAAQDEYREAGRVLTGFGDRRRVLEVDLKLAAVDLARGRPGPATDTVRKVADAARSEGFGPVEVQALRQQGDIALARRDRRAAVAFYEQALQQARDIGQSGDEIGLSVTLAGLHLDAGDPDAAAPLMGYLAGQPDSDLLRELRARYDRARAGSSAAQ